jgi:nicotinate-nucleotide adenylyltransferase
MGAGTVGRPVRGGLGVFGGTFDPIHLAHLAVAESARDSLGLDRVLFIPAGVPPHKPGQPITPAADRLAMVEAAIAGNPAFASSRIELDRPGPSYTVDTLEALSVSDPDLVLILSSEAYAGMPTWNDPLRVLELARLAVAPREGYPEVGPELVARHFPGMEGRVVVLDGPHIRLSASEIRSRAAAGRSLRYLVPDAVAAYIGDHGLYRTTRRDDRS